VVDDHAGILVRSGRVANVARVIRPAALGRRLPHRDEGTLGEYEVELRVVDEILVGDRDRDEEDAEDVVAVALQLRARLVTVLRRRQQLREGGCVDALGKVLPDLVLRRVEEIDPAVGRRRGRG
jgi:hypothetical protein